MRRTIVGVLLLSGAVAAAGCDNTIENLPTNPGPPPTTTVTFTGGINVNGAMTHTFTTVASGTVSATLTELTPDPAVPVGLMLGTWDGSACHAGRAMDGAVQGNALIATVTGFGPLCVRIHDTGRLTEPIGYTLTVIHP